MMAPRLFAFIWISSFSVVLLAWRSVCASLRCGNRWLRNGQRKQIIRTHLLSETSSDYIGLVRETGLEPVKTGYKLLILLEIIRSVACFVSYSIMKNDQAHVMVISMLILPIW